MSSEWIGWCSSLVLVLTIAKQLYKQWHDKTSQGVSKWLYLGQFGAETGFIIYSILLKNWVFAFTNVVLLLENLVGLGIVLYHRKHEHPKQP